MNVGNQPEVPDNERVKEIVGIRPTHSILDDDIRSKRLDMYSVQRVANTDFENEYYRLLSSTHSRKETEREGESERGGRLGTTYGTTKKDEDWKSGKIQGNSCKPD